MKYLDLENILKTVLPDAVYHLAAPSKADRYIVWAETGSDGRYADNRKIVSKWYASIYVYTQEEGDNLLERVCAALDDSNVAYSGAVPDYDDEMLTMGWIIECEFV